MPDSVKETSKRSFLQLCTRQYLIRSTKPPFPLPAIKLFILPQNRHALTVRPEHILTQTGTPHQKADHNLPPHHH